MVFRHDSWGTSSRRPVCGAPAERPSIGHHEEATRFTPSQRSSRRADQPSQHNTIIYQQGFVVNLPRRPNSLFSKGLRHPSGIWPLVPGGYRREPHGRVSGAWIAAPCRAGGASYPGSHAVRPNHHATTPASPGTDPLGPSSTIANRRFSSSLQWKPGYERMFGGSREDRGGPGPS